MGRCRVFPKRTIVVVEGEPADVLYLVLSGAVRVFVSDAEGREVELNRLGPGEYFGELMLGSPVRTASVVTLERTRLCLIGRPDFEAFLGRRPDLAFHLIQTMVERIRSLTQSVQSLSLMNVRGRVARWLVDASRIDTCGGRYAPRHSQQRIAEQVGASKSMVNKVLRDLIDAGCIGIRGDRIEIRQDLSDRY